MHARNQVAHRHRHDARLAQGRQDLLDVAQKQARRTNEQHARALQALAVGVQEIRDAVQGDRCLAGARPALDDQEALVRGADDAILLGLDRGDDVTHAPVARLAERMHERALALQLQAVRGRGIEQLVLQPRHAPITRRNVAATHDPLRLGRRRLIEGTRSWGAPVDEQGSPVIMGQ